MNETSRLKPNEMQGKKSRRWLWMGIGIVVLFLGGFFLWEALPTTAKRSVRIIPSSASVRPGGELAIRVEWQNVFRCRSAGTLVIANDKGADHNLTGKFHLPSPGANPTAERYQEVGAQMTAVLASASGFLEKKEYDEITKQANTFRGGHPYLIIEEFCEGLGVTGRPPPETVENYTLYVFPETKPGNYTVTVQRDDLDRVTSAVITVSAASS